MKHLKLIAAAILLLISSAGSAQTGNSTFIFRGNVGTDYSPILKFALTHPVQNKSFETEVDDEGNFCDTVSIFGSLQNMFLYLPKRTLTIPVAANDTLTLNYSAGNVSLTSSLKGRDIDLALALDFNGKSQRSLNKIISQVFNAKTDSARDAAADSANVHILESKRFISDFIAANGAPTDTIYFQSRILFPALRFFISNEDRIRNRIDLSILTNLESSGLTARNMLKYPDYNEYLTNLLRYLVHDGMTRFGNPENIRTQRTFNFIHDFLPDTLAADYVIAHEIGDMLSRKKANLDDMKVIAEEIERLSVPEFQSELRQAYADALLTAPGAQAPALTLTLPDGKKLTLEDLKGKYTYLDFWGEGCPPCMAEFKKMPEFKETLGKTADKINFVTVCCTNPSRESWQSIIDKYNLDDINTLLDTQDSHPVWNTNFFPCYVMIDPEGKIVEWNAARPSFLIQFLKRGIESPVLSALGLQ